MDSTSYCRLCALKCDNSVQLFNSNGTKLEIADKIEQCLQIWLFPEDVLPKSICTRCLNSVEQFYSFHSQCSRSQVVLLELFVGKPYSKSQNFEAILSKNDDSGTSKQPIVQDVDKTDLQVQNEVTPQVDSVSEIPSDGETKSETRKSKRRIVKKRYPNKSKDQNIKNDPELEKPSTSHSGPKDDSTSSNVGYLVVKDEMDLFEDKKPPVLEIKGYPCVLCTVELSTISQIKVHYKDVHDQSPVYKCPHCPKFYNRYRSFARHLKVHNEANKFSCDLCGKAFSQKTVLQAHQSVHTEERPHVCLQCGKAFKQFSSLYLHSKSHLPDQVKPKFPCSVCSKDFATKHILEGHMKIHTGERDYVCDVCGKSFIARSSLDYHILTHLETKPHSCSQCGKCFKTARLLIKHSAMHSGVKPHQCDVCGKQFRERGALKEHNRIHTGAMPYSCEYCGKLFRFKGILTVHRRVHTGERPYSCPECRREFTNWANYNKHMKRRHKDGPLPANSEPEPSTPIVESTSPISVSTLLNDPLPTPQTDVLQQSTSTFTTDSLKFPDEQDMYRVSTFIPSNLQMPTVAFYNMSPISSLQPVMQRTQ